MWQHGQHSTLSLSLSRKKERKKEKHRRDRTLLPTECIISYIYTVTARPHCYVTAHRNTQQPPVQPRMTYTAPHSAWVNARSVNCFWPPSSGLSAYYFRMYVGRASEHEHSFFIFFLYICLCVYIYIFFSLITFMPRRRKKIPKTQTYADRDSHARVLYTVCRAGCNSWEQFAPFSIVYVHAHEPETLKHR